VHHRDLSGGAAEAQRRDTQPDAERFADRDAMSGQFSILGTGKTESIDQCQAPFLLVGQLCVSLVASRHQR
jgi:hypothetical protein